MQSNIHDHIQQQAAQHPQAASADPRAHVQAYCAFLTALQADCPKALPAPQAEALLWLTQALDNPHVAPLLNTEYLLDFLDQIWASHQPSRRLH